MGLTFFAVVGLRLEPGHADQVADLLAAREDVTLVASRDGADVMIEIALPDLQAFGRFKEDVLVRLPGTSPRGGLSPVDITKLHYRLVRDRSSKLERRTSRGRA